MPINISEATSLLYHFAELGVFINTVLFLINAPWALHFSNRWHLFESNFERENPYKIAIKALKLPQNDEL